MSMSYYDNWYNSIVDDLMEKSLRDDNSINTSEFMRLEREATENKFNEIKKELINLNKNMDVFGGYLIMTNAPKEVLDKFRKLRKATVV